MIFTCVYVRFLKKCCIIQKTPHVRCIPTLASDARIFQIYLYTKTILITGVHHCIVLNHADWLATDSAQWIVDNLKDHNSSKISSQLRWQKRVCFLFNSAIRDNIKDKIIPWQAAGFPTILDQSGIFIEINDFCNSILSV